MDSGEDQILIDSAIQMPSVPVEQMVGESSLKEGKVTSVFVVAFTLAGVLRGDLKGQIFEVKLDGKGKALGGWQDGWKKTSPPLVPVHRFLDTPTDPFGEPQCFLLGDKLHVFLNCMRFPLYETETITRYHTLGGHVFNMKTKELTNFGHGIDEKSPATVFCAYGSIYFLLEPSSFSLDEFPIDDLNHTFERYNMDTGTWQPLTPFPYSFDWVGKKTFGYAICGKSILFSIASSTCVGVKSTVMAYHLDCNTWESVEIEDGAELCWSGRALVADSVVYALPLFRVDVITFSLRKGLGRSISLSKPSQLKGLEIKFPLLDYVTQYLTHLGGLEFCLVRCGFFFMNYDMPLQSISVTTFRIKEGEIKVLDSTMRFVDTEGFPLEVAFCFPMVSEDNASMNKERVWTKVLAGVAGCVVLVAGFKLVKYFLRD